MIKYNKKTGLYENSLSQKNRKRIKAKTRLIKNINDYAFPKQIASRRNKYKTTYSSKKSKTMSKTDNTFTYGFHERKIGKKIHSMTKEFGSLTSGDKRLVSKMQVNLKNTFKKEEFQNMLGQDRDKSIGEISYKSINSKYGLKVKVRERSVKFDGESKNNEYGSFIERIQERGSHQPLRHFQKYDQLTFLENRNFKTQSKFKYSEHKYSEPGNRYRYSSHRKPIKPNIFSNSNQLILKEKSLKVSKSDIKNKATPSMELPVIKLPFGKYQGEIFNNMLNGYGMIFNENNELMYEGGFLENDFNGFGITYNSEIEKSQTGISFIKNLNLVKSKWIKFKGLSKGN